MELYLGIDIGTTHIKVCAADTNGRVVKTALRDQESRPVPGWGNCISPEELWDKTAACLEDGTRSGERNRHNQHGGSRCSCRA